MTAELFSLLALDVADLAGLEKCVHLVRSLGNTVDSEVELDVFRAEVEYESAVRSSALELCSDLFHLYLASLIRAPEVPLGSGFEAWRVPAVSAKSVWFGLLELEGRALGLALPSLPEPGEPAEQVAARVLSAAECLGASAVDLALWRAHLVAADQGPAAGAASYQEVIQLGEMPFKDLEAAHMGYLGCLLVRGAVITAHDWSEAHMDLAAASPRLMRLAGWIQLAVGDVEAAEEYLTPQPRASLPGSIVALGDRLPDLRRLIGGCAEWRPNELAVSTLWTGSRRRDLGAVVLCVVHLEVGMIRIGHTELAPGLSAPSRAWLDRQEVAPFEEGEPECELSKTQSSVVCFPDSHGELDARRIARGCISSRCRGLALIPLFSEENGALAGWLRLEFEHRLVPETERLERFAKTVGRRLGLGARRPLAKRLTCPDASELFSDALGSFSLGRRRWWGFATGADSPELLCSDGTALDDWQENFGGRALLDECLRARRPLVHGGQEADFVHRSARAGLAIPLGPRGGVHRFALVIESTRAGDLGAKDVEGLLSGQRGDLRGLGARLEVAAFNQSHREVYGQDLVFSPSAPSPLPEGIKALGIKNPPTGFSHVDGVLGAVVAHGPGILFVCGPPGSGKRTVARLRAFLSGHRLRECQARGLSRASLEALFDQDAALIRDIEELAPNVQDWFLEAIEAGRANSVVTTSRLDFGQLEIWPRLSEVFERRKLVLEGLDRRRAEIPGLFKVGLSRAARVQRTVPPELTDASNALLWRQAWPRGIHGLFDLARHLVPLAHGRELDAPELLGLAAGLGWQLEVKLSTRQPDESALWQALVSTCKKSGSIHRGRSAALLGWDPDTLGARLKQIERRGQ